ncbi:hypothetical protein C2G38_2238525 [Gigaspora rosea]|uniref:Uncharacterized protein n=1 Tax=Gigaspora rosea TaxID=44941 RepID=A0A397W5N6_9GLOM|nr:hypothetical protein C2G38_2238525 [Gigaspora rosea]
MEESYGISSSSLSLNYSNFSRLSIKSFKSTPIDQAEEFIRDLGKLDNLIGFKQLVEDFEIDLPEEILIKALKLLSEASSFEYHSENTMIRLEVHLRTWISTLERVYYFPIILGREIREQIYKHLSDFVDFHHRMINAFKQGVDNSFKSKGKSKEVSNDNKIYMYFQNYNIGFLLIHLRDTLHSMRDDETRMDEILRRIKDFLLTLISIAPKATGTTSGNTSETLGISEILPNLAQVLSFKYPITYWYPTWQELLSIYYLLENFLDKDEDYCKLRFYNETYLLELLWQCIFDLRINQKTQNEILNNQNEILEFINLWTKKEPTAPPNSFWFGVLDLAQHLSKKTTQIVSLSFCYYLGLESLQNSRCNYICFKSLELLLSPSYQKPELFKDIVQDDINEYKESLPTTSQQILEKIIHDVTQKLKLNLKLIEESSMTSVKEKSIKSDRKLILNIIADELTCPITKQITGDFLILSCGHSISTYAINKWEEITKIENRLFECPFCKNKIELKSTYNLPKNKILEGLYEKLEQAGYFEKLSEEQILSNKIFMAEDDLFLKFNRYKIFQDSFISKLSTSILQKVQPKVMLPAFNKANKAEQKKDYEAVIIWLTQVLQLHPKSYSTRCRRAFASYKLKMYSKAKDDLDIAIKLKPLKLLAYIYRSFIFHGMNRYEDSLSDLNKSLEIDPNNALALRARGSIYFSLERYEESLADLNKSLEIEPNNAWTLGNRGVTYHLLRRYEESLTDLNKSLEIEQNNSWLFGNRGDTYCMLERYEESLADLNKSVRGKTYSMLNRYEESLVDLNKSLEIEPNNANALKIRGDIYRKLKRYEESFADLNKSLEIKPNNAETLRNRGETYYMLKRYDKSLTDFNKSLEIEPNNAETLRNREKTYNILTLLTQKS